jgi:hypothetical protein
LTFEIEALARDAEGFGGIVDPAAVLVQRGFHHLAFDAFECGIQLGVQQQCGRAVVCGVRFVCGAGDFW